VIIAAVALHAFAALWQHFYAKSDVLMRMLKPAAR
jgi:cytochrome b561